MKTAKTNKPATKTARRRIGISSTEMGISLITTLRAQADEIAREGHAGWGNTMTLAADTLEKLQSDAGSASTD